MLSPVENEVWCTRPGRVTQSTVLGKGTKSQLLLPERLRYSQRCVPSTAFLGTVAFFPWNPVLRVLAEQLHRENRTAHQASAHDQPGTEAHNSQGLRYWKQRIAVAGQ